MWGRRLKFKPGFDEANRPKCVAAAVQSDGYGLHGDRRQNTCDHDCPLELKLTPNGLRYRPVTACAFVALFVMMVMVILIHNVVGTGLGLGE